MYQMGRNHGVLKPGLATMTIRDNVGATTWKSHQWRTQDFVKGGAKPDENIADDKKKIPVGVGSLTVFG